MWKLLQREEKKTESGGGLFSSMLHLIVDSAFKSQLYSSSIVERLVMHLPQANLWLYTYCLEYNEKDLRKVLHLSKAPLWKGDWIPKEWILQISLSLSFPLKLHKRRGIRPKSSIYQGWKVIGKVLLQHFCRVLSMHLIWNEIWILPSIPILSPDQVSLSRQKMPPRTFLFLPFHIWHGSTLLLKIKCISTFRNEQMQYLRHNDFLILFRLNKRVWNRPQWTITKIT